MNRDIAGDWSFRLPFLLQMIPALVVGTGIHFFPFSPRWLAMRNRNEESLESLARLRRVPPTDETVQLEWKGILTEDRFQKQILQNQHPNSGPIMLEIKQWLDLFRPRYLKRTFVAIAIPFFQQFSGVNAFVYYAPTFFAELGQGYEMSLILSGMVNVCQFVGSVPMLVYLDSIGRRNIAIYGGIIMAIPHIVMAGIVGRFSSNWESHRGVGWFGVALVCEFRFPLHSHLRFEETNHCPKICTSSATPFPTVRSPGSSQQKFSPAPGAQKALASRLRQIGCRISSSGRWCRRCLFPLAGARSFSSGCSAWLRRSFRSSLCRRRRIGLWNRLPWFSGTICRLTKRICVCRFSGRSGLRLVRILLLSSLESIGPMRECRCPKWSRECKSYLQGRVYTWRSVHQIQTHQSSCLPTITE